jgi:small GTP-binding protein
MKFKKFTALICAFAFMSLNLINVSAVDHKLVLLGDTGAGKTQIVGRMVGRGFDVQHIPTIGVDYAALDVGADNRLGLWDIAGRERFRAIVPAYLRNTKIVVVIVDITNPLGVDDVNVWCDLANQHCPNAPKVLVVSKIDLENQAYVETVPRDAFDAKASEFGIGHVFFVSAKTGEGIEDFRNGLAGIAHRLPADAHEFDADPVVAEPRTEAAVRRRRRNSSPAKTLMLGTLGFGVIGGTALWCSLKNRVLGNQTQNFSGDEVTE